MAELSNYIRNIAIFLIFSSFVSIIMPGEKFKQYIDLLLGIVLIFVVIAPLGGIIAGLSGGSGDIFRDIGLEYDRAVLSRQIEWAQEAGMEAVLQNYHDGLTEQLQRIVGNHGFTLENAEFKIDTTQENFGTITSLNAVLTPGHASGQSLINIDPVRINTTIGQMGQDPQRHSAAHGENDAESPQIMSLKNVISDFYNLDIANIILETRDGQ